MKKVSALSSAAAFLQQVASSGGSTPSRQRQLAYRGGTGPQAPAAPLEDAKLVAAGVEACLWIGAQLGLRGGDTYASAGAAGSRIAARGLRCRR